MPAIIQRDRPSDVFRKTRLGNRIVIGGGIGLGTGMGLDVGVFGAKQFFGSIDGQIFRDINKFAAAVIPFLGIALGVLVGQYTSLGFHDRQTGGVF